MTVAHMRTRNTGAAVAASCAVILGFTGTANSQGRPVLASAEEWEEFAVGFEPNQHSVVPPFDLGRPVEQQFWKDTVILFKPRSYYLDRDRDTEQDNVGWALGGALTYTSGWWKEAVLLSARVDTSQVLYGPSGKDGTLLFKPGPESFTVLSEANVTLRVAPGQGLRIGLQSLNLPYLGSHDIRMVPNTFEGIVLGNKGSIDVRNYLAYRIGYVSKIKRKNDDEFIPMSEAAGVPGGDDGVAAAALGYILGDGTRLAATNQYSFNTFNTLFAKIEHGFSLGEATSLTGYLQYTDQRSVGDELIGEFATYLVSAKAEWKQDDTTLRFGVSTTGEDKGIQKPYGNPANYLSVIVEDFDRAGEDAWMIGVSHDFGRLGGGDLSLFANVVRGNTPDSGPVASPDETEYDLTVDYRMKEGWTDTLWFRVRAAYIDEDERTGGDDYFDFRIIVNYSFDLK